MHTQPKEVPLSKNNFKVKTEAKLLEISKRIRALSQNGLLYSLSEYDTERYEELLDLSNRITSLLTDYPQINIQNMFLPSKEYVTPKVDIRAVVFNNKEEILMVREKADGLWSLPGGWSDIGFSPKEVAEKEVHEETGLVVKAQRLLTVQDMSKHEYPPIPFYVYKFFILCELKSGEFTTAFDIIDKGFFSKNSLPPLSLERVTESEIDLMFDYYSNPSKETICD